MRGKERQTFGVKKGVLAGGFPTVVGTTGAGFGFSLSKQLELWLK